VYVRLLVQDHPQRIEQRVLVAHVRRLGVQRCDVRDGADGHGSIMSIPMH
jgi:hypothetical protein